MLLLLCVYLKSFLHPFIDVLWCFVMFCVDLVFSLFVVICVSLLYIFVSLQLFSSLCGRLLSFCCCFVSIWDHFSWYIRRINVSCFFMVVFMSACACFSSLCGHFVSRCSCFSSLYHNFVSLCRLLSHQSDLHVTPSATRLASLQYSGDKVTFPPCFFVFHDF